MAQTLQSLYSIPSVVPQLSINNTFTATNTFTGNVALQGNATVSAYGSPFLLPEPGATAGNWYILGVITFNAGSGSVARIEINGSTSYSTGSLIAGHDVIELRMGNNTGTSTAPDVTGNYYRIGDAGTSPIVGGTLKLVSVNSSVTDNQYQIWYQSNTFTRYSRLYFYSSDATFVFSGTYQSTGDPSLTVANPSLYVYVVPRTVSLAGATIGARGRLLVNSPTDDGTSALIVNGASSLGATTIGGALNGGVSYWTTSGTETDMFFRTNSSASTQMYLALSSASFAINYTDGSGNYAGQGLYISRTNGAVTIPTTLTIPNSGFALALGGNGIAAPTWITVNTAAGNNRGLVLQTAGSNRWVMYVSNSAESGSNVGSDFQILRYNDAGTQIDAPITIARSTGVISISQYFGMANGQTLASWPGSAYIQAGPGGGTVTIGSNSGNLLSINAGTPGSSTAKWTCGPTGTTNQSGTATISTGTSGAGVSIATVSSNNSLTINDTGSFGAGILFQGNGATTPNKYVRVMNGSYQIISNNYATALFSMDDSGNTSHAGEVQSTTANGFRIVGASYGVFWRFDGSTMYLLRTASGSPLGSWDGSRPFAWNMSGGITTDQGWTFATTVTFTAASVNWGSGQAYAYQSTSGAFSWRTGVTGGTAYYFGFNTDGSMGINGTYNGGNFVIGSDERIKTWIADLDGSENLDKLMRVTPRLYEKLGKREYGVYAQQLRALWPDMVMVWDNSKQFAGLTDYHSIYPEMLQAVHLSATQQINKELQELKLTVETQAIRIAELEARQ